MIEISNGNLKIELCEPGSFYKGTRFDWTGVFRRITFNGREFSDLWFDGIDPLRHDNLTGCSEEFAPVWLDSTHCVKPGVGVLYVPEGEGGYDHFKLYDIANPGIYSCDSDETVVRFRHFLDGFYDYVKTISLNGDNRFEISHKFLPISSFPFKTTNYNHNFFTFGKKEVGPSRRFVFDSRPVGDWRKDSVNGLFKGCELGFERVMAPGETSFIGNLRLVDNPDKPYRFKILEGDSSVDVHSDVPMDYAVFWTNHRVACVEPYVKVEPSASESFDWKIEYELK